MLVESTHPLLIAQVVGWVEDAIARVGVRCEKAGWGEVMEVAEGLWVSYWLIIYMCHQISRRFEDLLFAHRKDVFSRKKILDPDVAVPVVPFPHLLEGVPEINRLHPADRG